MNGMTLKLVELCVQMNGPVMIDDIGNNLDLKKLTCAT